MKIRLMRSTAAALVGAMLLSGCVTTSGGTPSRPLTPQEQALREQSKAYDGTRLEGAALGCVSGALVGILVGASTSGKKGALVGGAAGCAAGGIGGYAWGSYVADKQKQFATAEQQYGSMLDDARAENTRLNGFVDASRKVMADDSARLEQINGQLASGKINLEKAKSEVAIIDENTAEVESSITGLKKREKELLDIRTNAKSLGNPAERQQMDGEIGTLQRQIALLQGDLDTLVQHRKVSRVG